MTRSTRRWIQVSLALLLLAAGIRLVLVFRNRGNETAAPAKQAAPPLAADYYVTPRKLHDYDAASLRKDLAGKPVWIREGYRYTYFACPAPGHHVDFKHEGGTAGPIEKLDIRDVITQPAQGGDTQIMVVFSKDGQDWCLSVGAQKGDRKQIFADEIFYYDDPHILYKHWTPEMWAAIDRHEMKPGMNEFQACFAIGMGVPVSGGGRVLRYPNGGHPLTVTYENGVATEIGPG